MKLIIPSEIKIGCVKIRIVFNEELMFKMDTIGYASTKDQTIYLSNRHKTDRKFGTLIHEILHICATESGAEMDESVVTGVATLMAQALVSMQIEPDFSQIPEE